MATFEVVYGRICRSPVGWYDVCESSLYSPEIIYEALGKVYVIRNRYKIAYSRQKSYADHRRRDLEFKVGSMVYLNISPMEAV